MKGTAARRYINSLHHLDNLGVGGVGCHSCHALETSNVFDQLGDGGRLIIDEITHGDASSHRDNLPRKHNK